MDRSSIEAFVRSDYAEVVAAVGFVTGDRSSAEDAVQDVLASLLDSGTEVRHSRAFVVTAALNNSRSRLRRRGAERRALDRLRARPTIPQDVSMAVDDEVLAALRALPRRQREIVALHYLLDMGIAEVASTLDVSAGTVKTQLHRARATMRQRFIPGDREHVEEVEDVHR